MSKNGLCGPGGYPTPISDPSEPGHPFLWAKERKDCPLEARRDGYLAATPKISTIRAMVIESLKGHNLGLTAEEIQRITGFSLNSVRSRLTELSTDCVVMPIGRRPGASGVKITVWRLK